MGRSGELPGKSGDLLGKSGKLPGPGNLDIALKIHKTVRSSGEVAGELPSVPPNLGNNMKPVGRIFRILEFGLPRAKAWKMLIFSLSTRKGSPESLPHEGVENVENSVKVRRGRREGDGTENVTTERPSSYWFCP